MGEIYLELVIVNLQDFRVVIDMERHAVSRARAMKAKMG
jgi:hypothetical protein